MPKLKTRKAVAKRVSVTGSGKLKKTKANKQHILTKKNTKRLRDLRKSDLVDKTNMKQMKRCLPYI
ncbi:MAG: 50S ribosomal protein L35 [Firmicutes bacterium]|jgi:large subunit ribosomal protein L35|nr:50S ribosomal protein L35 [Bacillota bacterium]MBQ6555279.1 50S ribosomal protein L35 [Bacillota bacterium]MBR6401413.1 50S ribosomal protein L35 [Bacillota bacterium]